jgi:hypothetical protein
MTMHHGEDQPPTRPSLLIRLARALRAMHQEQVYAMECLLRLTPAPQADPLTWIWTRGGRRTAARRTWRRPPSPGR